MKGKKTGGWGGGRRSQGKRGTVNDGETLLAACTWLSVIFATPGPSYLLVPLGRRFSHLCIYFPYSLCGWHMWECWSRSGASAVAPAGLTRTRAGNRGWMPALLWPPRVLFLYLWARSLLAFPATWVIKQFHQNSNGTNENDYADFLLLRFRVWLFVVCLVCLLPTLQTEKKFTRSWSVKRFPISLIVQRHVLKTWNHHFIEESLGQ